jgi:hypothetical protein
LKARYGHGKAARSYTWPRKELNAKLFPERAGFFFTLEFQMATESFLRWQAAIASREVDASPGGVLTELFASRRAQLIVLER